MNSVVTLNKNLSINFPSDIKESFKHYGFEAGKQFVVLVYNGSIVLIPVSDDIRKMRGFLKGIDTNIERDEEDRL